MKNICLYIIMVMSFLSANAQVVTVESGATLFIGDGVTVTAEDTANISGTLHGKGTWSGVVTIKTGGKLSGKLSITGNLLNEAGGTVAPGNSIDTITITGDFTNAGTIEIEIGSTIDTIDVINVSGTFNAGGTLSQVNFSSYAPSNGDEANFLNSGAAVMGTFSTTPSAPWMTEYDNPASGDVTLKAVVVPVELLTFTGKAIEGSTWLMWQTASEINADRFEIERSTDSRNWELIGTIKAVGNSVDIQYYEFMDATPLHGINYYRLRQVDMGTNGLVDYSDIISVRFHKDSPFMVYPNPTADILYFEYNDEVTKVEIWNTTGTLLQSINMHSQQEIDVSNYSNGVYFIRFLNKDNILLGQEKVIKFGVGR